MFLFFFFFDLVLLRFGKRKIQVTQLAEKKKKKALSLFVLRSVRIFISYV